MKSALLGHDHVRRVCHPIILVLAMKKDLGCPYHRHTTYEARLNRSREFESWPT